MSLYFRILRYLKPYIPLFLMAVGALFLFAFFDIFSIALFIPFLRALFKPEAVGETGDSSLDQQITELLGRIVDLDAPPETAVKGIIIVMISAFALKNVFGFLGAYLVARVDQGVTRDMRREVYSHLLDLDLVFFGRTKMGQILSRMTHDIEQLRRLVTQELAKLISSTFEFGLSLALMVAISGRLTLAAFVVLPGMFLIWGPLLKKLRKQDRSVLDLAGDVNSHIQETLSGIRLVKASAAETHERARFGDLTERYFVGFVRAERLRALAAPISEMLAAVGTAILLYYGTRLVIYDQILTSEAFIVFIVGSTKLYTPVKYISRLPATIQPGLVAAERVFEFLDAPVEIRDSEGAADFAGISSEVSFADVGFAYRADQPVLRDIDFTAAKGTVTALVGPSGAGKTTLVDLLGRFYEVSSGSISVDGRDIRDFTVRSLRRAMGIVSQETVLFHDTVRNNLAYGAEDPSPQEVEEAARSAHAHEFIMELPQGYDTVVGERGTELSGGQRQRLAIARAILRDPPILIFDEATSALDTESERLVQQATQRLLTGRTVFVIAHRLSTIQQADQILVLTEGCIVERGTHTSLMDDDGVYRRLYDLQFPDAALSLRSGGAGDGANGDGGVAPGADGKVVPEANG